jgi:hypothetical protein
MKGTKAFRAALAELEEAENRAAATAYCSNCQRTQTLRVQLAEAHLLKLICSTAFERVLDAAER